MAIFFGGYTQPHIFCPKIASDSGEVTWPILGSPSVLARGAGASFSTALRRVGRPFGPWGLAGLLVGDLHAADATVVPEIQGVFWATHGAMGLEKP